MRGQLASAGQHAVLWLLGVRFKQFGKNMTRMTVPERMWDRPDFKDKILVNLRGRPGVRRGIRIEDHNNGLGFSILHPDGRVMEVVRRERF